MEHTIIAENVFIYSPWNGRLKVYEGRVAAFGKNQDEGLFHSNEPIKKRLGCHVESGKVFNCVVWFHERNDALAAALLIQYEKSRIAALTETIANHQYRIDMLTPYIIKEDL
jgi:hypothetical protein